MDKSFEEKLLEDALKSLKIETEALRKLVQRVYPRLLASAIFYAIDDDIVRQFCYYSYGTDVRKCYGKLREAFERNMEKLYREAENLKRRGVADEYMMMIMTAGTANLFYGIAKNIRDLIELPLRKGIFFIQKHFLELVLEEAKVQEERLHLVKYSLATHPMLSLDTKVKTLREIVLKVSKGEIDLYRSKIPLDELGEELRKAWEDEIRKGKEETFEDAGRLLFLKEQYGHILTEKEKRIIDEIISVNYNEECVVLVGKSYEEYYMKLKEEFRKIEEKLGAEEEKIVQKGLEKKEFLRLPGGKEKKKVEIKPVWEIRDNNFNKYKDIKIYDGKIEKVFTGEKELFDEIKNILREYVPLMEVENLSELVKIAFENENVRKVIDEVLKEDKKLLNEIISLGKQEGGEELLSKMAFLLESVREELSEEVRAKEIQGRDLSTELVEERKKKTL